MPFVTFADRYVRELGLIEGTHLAIESVLELRFPDALAELMPQVHQVMDLDRLHGLLELAKKGELADIQAAISPQPV